MKTMITLLAGLLLIVNSANAQQETQPLIALPVNPASEQVQVDGPSKELVACEMILDGQSDLPQGNAFQNRTSLAQQQLKTRPREYNHDNNSLSRGQKVGMILAIPGAIATAVGVVLIATDDTKRTSGGGYGSFDISDQVAAGLVLVLVGAPLLVSGGITLLVSSISKSRR